MANQKTTKGNRKENPSTFPPFPIPPFHYDPERGFEIGKDEAWFANVKRTYDLYEFMTVAIMNDARVLTAQIYQNAIATTDLIQKNTAETSNMVGKQAVRHGDIAINQQWPQASLDAIAAGVAAKVWEKVEAKLKG